MSEFIIKLPVRWGDMDAFNHVSNVVYLRYIEDCRGQWMQSVPSHWQEADTGPVVANININYRRPLYWPETLEVTLVPDPPGRSSIRLLHEIRSAGPDSSRRENRVCRCQLHAGVDKQENRRGRAPARRYSRAGGRGLTAPRPTAVSRRPVWPPAA